MPDQQTSAFIGHPIHVTDVHATEIRAKPTLLSELLDASQTAVIVRQAMPEGLVKTAVSGLSAPENTSLWTFPNRGMTGGEIRTIGAAATPTFTAFRGPDAETYEASALQHKENVSQIFGANDPAPHIENIFAAMLPHGEVGPPAFSQKARWLPFNLRALDPGQQIYSHHDNHYGLSIYDALPERFDRTHLLSWFITLQAPESGGELVIYGLWGSDPDPPMLPTRFLDTDVLERDYRRCSIPMRAGDMVIFDSGRHVHRVTPVDGIAPRYTLGGFLTVDHQRTEIAYWS